MECSLTQRSVVNQLKSDMEKLQEEIKAQLVSIIDFGIFASLFSLFQLSN